MHLESSQEIPKWESDYGKIGTDSTCDQCFFPLVNKASDQNGPFHSCIKFLAKQIRLKADLPLCESNRSTLDRLEQELLLIKYQLNNVIPKLVDAVQYVQSGTDKISFGQTLIGQQISLLIKNITKRPAAKKQHFVESSGTLSEVLANTSQKVEFLRKKAKKLEHQSVNPTNDYLLDFGLVRLPLHEISESMKQGRYFEFPSQKDLEGKPLDYFKDYEFSEVRYCDLSGGEGIVPPQLVLLKEGVGPQDQPLVT